MNVDDDLNKLRARRKSFTVHLQNALQPVNGRYYMLAETPEEIALAAVLSTWQAVRAEQGKSYDPKESAEFLAQLKSYYPSLFQNKPEPEHDPTS